MPMTFVRNLLALVFLTGASAATVVAAPASGTVQIDTASGKHTFRVELVRSREDMQKGLMFRRTLAEDRGMLFDFQTPQQISMWMKNTYLSLDMLFIRADGTIARIAADTEPLSTAIIASGEPVLAVLELNAGTAAKLGLRSGDRVEHPLFRKGR